MKKYLSFDIGGTQIKYGIVNENGDVVFHSLMDTEAHIGGMYIMKKIIESAKGIMKRYQIQGITISTAGVVDADKGIVLGASDAIPNYTGLNIKEILLKELHLPVTVRNDADCAALCEKWLGGHQVDNFIMLTIGTGVGGGIVINDELYSGHSFSAGEWGYMNIEGSPFQEIASITGLINMAKTLSDSRAWTGREIYELYDKGDESITKVVSRFYRHLAIGISNLIYIFNPQKVIIGGGITARGDQFVCEIKEELRKHIKESFYRETDLVLAKYSNQAGLIGAVYNFIQEQSN
ncbi:ROK family protein [Radiobacillus sp. PE A8.2]|uniref:ROK family protein n=1 Tax=Radiobacillus sp. PE A8.2 TaxID=3380349 RepID=UPI00388D6242